MRGTITLTEEQAETIRGILDEYFGVIDGSLYHQYSREGLAKELDRISEAKLLLYPQE